MRTVYPTGDRGHYLARARHYERVDEHEPDPIIREALPICRLSGAPAPGSLDLQSTSRA
jgi:hypothetical protein